MRSLFFTLILSFVFCAAAFAQETSPCPVISVMGPSAVVRPGQHMIFVINDFDDLDKFKFEWSISAGTISEGQGTPIIKVSTSGVNDGEVKAIVKVVGLPENCENSAFSQGEVSVGDHPYPIDVYERISFRKERIRLKNVVEQFQETKDSLALFIFSVDEKDSFNALKMRTSNIVKYLTQNLKIPKDKIKFIFSGTESYRTRIYILRSDGFKDDPVWDVSGWENRLDEFESKRQSPKKYNRPKRRKR